MNWAIYVDVGVGFALSLAVLVMALFAGREPAEFPLNRVIKGWTDGVQLMKEGAKFRFFIPSHLAYGTRGAGIDIGPDETLIFEVELLKVWED